MSVLDEVDTIATYHRVDNFLKTKLPRLTRLCGRSLTELSSPKLSFAPMHSNYSSGQENKMIAAFSAEKMVNAIYQSINHCTPESKKIIIDSYIKCIPQLQLVTSLPYESTTYYATYKPKALNEFADLYDHYQLSCNVDDDDIIDFHVYKK